MIICPMDRVTNHSAAHVQHAILASGRVYHDRLVLSRCRDCSGHFVSLQFKHRCAIALLCSIMEWMFGEIPRRSEGHFSAHVILFGECPAIWW